MAKEEDRKRLQRLTEEIATLKDQRLDEQHAKFKDWSTGVRSVLKVIYGDGSSMLKRFETLHFRRRGDRMWGDDDRKMGGKERAHFKRGLDEARALLEEALEGIDLLSDERKEIGEDEFVTSMGEVSSKKKAPDKAEVPVPKETVEEVVEMQDEEKMAELLRQLNKEMQDPGADVRKVQSTMEDLLKVKKRVGNLQRLTQEVKDPKAPWGKIRELMKGVWETDRKLLVDTLPEILED